MVVKKWLSKMGTFLKEPFNRFGIVSCWIEFTSSPIPNLSCETSVLRCLTRSYTCSTRRCWCSIAFYPRHPFSRNHSFVSRGFLYTCRFLSRVTIILLLLSLRKEQLVTPEMKLSSFFLSVATICSPSRRCSWWIKKKRGGLNLKRIGQKDGNEVNALTKEKIYGNLEAKHRLPKLIRFSTNKANFPPPPFLSIRML